MKHVFFVAAFAAAVAAQQQPQRPVFRAGVETVQVDVVVRDSNGHPVAGLTADDFVVLDRDRPQQIVAFKAVQRATQETPSFGGHFPLATRLDVSSNQIARAERLVVLVLDDLHGYRGRDDVVKKIARGIVEKLGADVLVALLMTSGNYNVEITEDRSRIIAGIERFKGARAVRRPMQAIDDRRGSGAGVQPPGRGQTSTVTRDTGADLQEFDANLRMYATLESAARLFSATDGRRKAFVLISENLSKDLTGVLQVQRVAPDAVGGSEAYIAGNLEGMTIRNPVAYHDLAVLAAIESLRKSNVVTYAIDPRGEVSSQEMLEECHPHTGWGNDPCTGDHSSTGPPSMSGWVRLAQQGLQQFAVASGGFAVVNSDDFAGGINRIIGELDNYYLLGFNTDDSRTKGFRRLEVQVKNRRDVQLRYRRGYEIGSKGDSKPPVRDFFFSLADGALPKPDVPLRFTASALPGSGRDARVPVAIEITVPRLGIEEADRALRDQIQYGVTVVDMRGSKVKEAHGYGARLVLRPRAIDRTPPNLVTYQVGLQLTLPPGRYHLRALVSSSKLAEGGSVYLPLDVPDFTKEPIALSALVVGYGSGPRVPTATGRSPAQAEAARRIRMASPTDNGRFPGDLPFHPTLDREFLLADDVGLYFEVQRKDRSRPVSINLMAVDADDRVVRRFDQTLPPASAGKVSVRLPLKEIGPGAFRLRVRVSDGVNEATSEVPILIKAADGRGSV